MKNLPVMYCPEIDVNLRDHKEDTPLLIGTKIKNFGKVEKLIWGNANID